MSKIKFAFVRETDPRREIDNTELFQLIRKSDIAEHNVFVDTITINEARKELLEMLEPQDVLLVRSITDLSINNVDNMVKILEYLQNRKVKLCSIEEPQLSSSYPYSNFKQLKAVASYYAEIKRKKAYDAALKAKKVGRPKKAENINKSLKMYGTGKFTIDEICELCKISKSTFYRAVKDYKNELKSSIEARNKSIAAAEAADRAEEEVENYPA